MPLSPVYAGYMWIGSMPAETLFSCCQAQYHAARPMCKSAKSARPPATHHCRLLPLCITPPVCLLVARVRAVESRPPHGHKPSATDHTGQCDRTSRHKTVFGPVCVYSTLRTTKPTVGAFGRVFILAVLARCHNCPSPNRCKACNDNTPDNARCQSRISGQTSADRD